MIVVVGEAAKALLERVHKGVKNAAEDLLMPVYERIHSRTSPEEKQKYRAESETYRKADDEFQLQREAYRKRKAGEAKEE